MKKTKKLISAFLVICLFFASAPLTGFSVLDLSALNVFHLNSKAAEIIDSGECGEDGDNVIWMLDSDGTLNISGTGNMANYIYKESPFSNNKIISKVLINDGVTSIGEYSFTECENLETLYLSNSVISIGKYAFEGCKKLELLIIPNSVTTIGEDAFAYCYGLESVSMGNGIAEIGSGAFDCCEKLADVLIYDLSAWCNIFFVGSTHANPLNYAKNLFLNGELITNLVIPESITQINSHVFEGYSSLKSVNITEGVTIIGTAAFMNCSNLEFVKIPSTVNVIASSAFYQCLSMKTISLPEGVKSIGEKAFYGCSKLYDIDIPNSVNAIGSSAFSGTSWYNKQEDGIVYAGKVLYDYKGSMSSDTTIYVSDTCIATAERAFAWEEGLRAVVFPDSLTRIAPETFYGCDNLESVELGNSVEYIGYEAFKNCHSLSSIVLPDGLKTISRGAFDNCSSLVSVKIPNGITSIGIGTFSLFSNCEKLSSIYLPSSLQYIWGRAFSNCNALTEITVDKDNPFLYSINNCVINKEDKELVLACKSSIIPLDGTVESIGAYAFVRCDDFTQIIIPNSIKTIKKGAFLGNNIRDVYYQGSKSQWERISIEENNGPLDAITIHFADNPGYFINFNANGGTGAPSAQTKSENEPLTLSSAIPTKSYTISYNAAGGSVTPTSKSVNCTFRNWNTSQNGGGVSYNPGGTYTANADATLYAQWTNPTAGALPTPTRSGFIFEGWYTSAVGGTKVTASSAITGNTTIYAHWSGTTPIQNIYNLGEETYSFANYGDADSSGGHCFGMSMTSSAYYLGLLDIRDIGGSADKPLYSLSFSDTVKAPICQYQAVQGSYAKNAIVAGGSTYLKGRSDISSDWTAVVNYVKNHDYDDTGLLQIGFRKDGEGGHAINFLRYENVSGQDRIYAYDNNFPTLETYFYRDASGKVLQTPVQSFSGAIDCIALRDVRTFMRLAGDFNASRAVYAAKDKTTIQDFSYSYMDGEIMNQEYVMYEIPEGTDKIKSFPMRITRILSTSVRNTISERSRNLLTVFLRWNPLPKTEW